MYQLLFTTSCFRIDLAFTDLYNILLLEGKEISSYSNHNSFDQFLQEFPDF